MVTACSNASADVLVCSARLREASILGGRAFAVGTVARGPKWAVASTEPRNATQYPSPYDKLRRTCEGPFPPPPSFISSDSVSQRITSFFYGARIYDCVTPNINSRGCPAVTELSYCKGQNLLGKVSRIRELKYDPPLIRNRKEKA